ncbi:tail fiber domain-containing protein [Winogradskyella pulchriflava]|uniref:Tail fiber domain-containing protein n=1 Tax=Winogradskyella pulchriflava TaxID=1110688 RepID=A0ABV6QBU6_9FLAO
MKKHIRLSLISMLFIGVLYGQVGINTTNPEVLLDIRSSDQASPANTDGILIPKIDNFPATNPTAVMDGMMVYLTADVIIASVTYNKGFYYWDNNVTSWINIQGAERVNDLIDGKSDTGGSSIFLGVGAGQNDDGSGNHNAGFGYNALRRNTTGTWNSALGNNALQNNVNGYGNVGIGTSALHTNHSGYNNIAVGFSATRSITSGAFNIGIGYESFYYSTVGNGNIGIGTSVGRHLNGNSSNNILIGNSSGAGSLGHTKSNNIFIGHASGYYETNSDRLYIENSNSSSPLIYGEFDNDLLRVNGTLDINNAYQFPTVDGTVNQVLQTDGSGSLSWTDFTIDHGINDLTDGKSDISNGSSIFLGVDAGLSDDGTDNQNLGIGAYALQNNTDGTDNIGLGSIALTSNTSGDGNVAIGNYSFYQNNNGNYNTALGNRSGWSNVSGSRNVFLGNNAGHNELGSNKLYIENSSADANNALIYGEFDNDFIRVNGNFQVSGEANLRRNAGTGVALRVNGAEALWFNGTYFSYGFGGSANYFSDNVGIGIGPAATNPNAELVVVGDIEYTGTITDVSDRRLKENLEPINNVLERLQNIKGYSYNMISDETKEREYGVIAQDLQKVFPEMVSVIDSENQYLGVSYIQMIPVLLEAIKEQQSIIESQNEKLKRFDSIEAELASIRKLLSKN